MSKVLNICIHVTGTYSQFQKLPIKVCSTSSLQTQNGCLKMGISLIMSSIGQNHDIQMRNRSFESVAQLKYFGTIVTNQNLIQEEIKRRLNLGNVCYYSVQNLLFSHLLSKKVKIGVNKNYNFAFGSVWV
jgi:hypothetical protein